MTKKSKYDFDLTGWNEIRSEVEHLEGQRGPLIRRFEKVEEIYFMDWDSKNPDVIETISPEGRNKVDGATMLLTAATPKFNVPTDKNNPDAERLSSGMEKVANQMWAASNTEQSTTIETDLAFSGFMYDEMTARVISTNDMLEAVKSASEQARQEKNYNKERWEAEIAHAEKRAERTPYLFEALYPKIAHPIYSRNELLALYTKTEMRVADVLKDYGDRADTGTMKDYQTVTVCEWFDKSHRYTWIDGDARPIYAEPHGLNFLPAASVRVKGKRFFDKAERQNEPFLFSVLTSGIWPLQNAMLTAMAENVNRLINAGFVYKPDRPESELETIHHEIVGNVVRVDGTLTPLAKELIHSDTLNLWLLVDGIFEDSTIYGQALGERLGSNAPFSMVAMLAQAGRLPIVPVQRGLRTILAQLMEIAFRWWKLENKSYTYVTDFKPQDIPNVIDFDVTVEPDLPQDKVQMANVAASMTSGDDPLLPKRWAREFLGEGQSDEIQKEIWTEQAAAIIYRQNLEAMLKQQPQEPEPEVMAQVQAMLQQRQMMEQGMQQGIQQGQMMPQQPETMPPEMRPPSDEGGI